MKEVVWIVEKYCPVEGRILTLRKRVLDKGDLDTELPIRITMEGKEAIVLKDTFTLRETALQVLQKPPTTGLC